LRSQFSQPKKRSSGSEGNRKLCSFVNKIEAPKIYNSKPTMSKHEKQKIEEELFFLMKLIEFHNGARNTMWTGRDKEFEERMNAMLDHMNELRKKLDLLNKNDKK
jgi:hypothetical protein